MADKVYEPEVIQDAPFPGEPVIVGTQSQSSSGDIYSPTTTKEKPFKKKIIASETIGQALNTRSKKVLQEFELQQSGGFKVGDFKQGVSGDLRITPNGLTARDIAGTTTFAIDGTTGDAVFKGEVQAGSVVAGALISGDITVGGVGNSEGEIHVLDSTDVEKVTIDKDGIVISSGKLTIKDSAETTIIDSTGLVSSANFKFGSIYLDEPADFTDTNWADIPSTSQTFNLSRTTRVLFLVTIQGNTNGGTAGVRMAITGIAQGDIVPELEFNSTAYPLAHNIHRVFEVPAATPVTFKLQGRIVAPATALQFGGGYITSTFVVLGT